MSRSAAASDCTEDAGRQEDDGADQMKHAVHGDAHHAKWQQEQPDDGIKDQSQQRQRPAQDQENAPKKEFDHGYQRLDAYGLIFRYARDDEPVPVVLSMRQGPGGSCGSLLCKLVDYVNGGLHHDRLSVHEKWLIDPLPNRVE